MEINTNAGPTTEGEFKKELTALINKHSMENMGNVPDFILADFLYWSLLNFSTALQKRDNWFKPPSPNMVGESPKEVK